MAAFGKGSSAATALLCLAIVFAGGAGCKKKPTGKARQATVSAPNVVSVRSRQDFETKVKSADTPVLVEFCAGWCGACGPVSAALDAHAAKYEGKVLFVRIDVDEARELSQEIGVRQVPTVVVFVGGKRVREIVGAKQAADYAAALDEVVASQASDSADAGR